MKLRLTARTNVVRDVRHRVADWAKDNGAERDVLRTVALLTSELVTNAVEHGPAGGDITVDARCDEDGFRVEVTDENPAPPVIRRRDIHQVRGRGMQLVDLLSSDWGVNAALPRGKSVWFQVAT